jgi:hypothetical protein
MEETSMNRYFGFDDRDDVKGRFDYNGDDFPTDDQILFAAYGGGSYDGIAKVIFEKDGKVYEVNASHCSCYGLEDQWSPEETSWEAMKKYKLDSYDYGDDGVNAYKELMEAH